MYMIKIPLLKKRIFVKSANELETRLAKENEMFLHILPSKQEIKAFLKDNPIMTIGKRNFAIHIIKAKKPKKP